VKERYFFFNDAKSWLLIQPERIPTISLKWLSWAVRFVAGNGWSGWSL